MSDNNLIYALNTVITVPGSLGVGIVKDEGSIRFVLTNAGPANVVRIRAKLTGMTTWVTLIDLTGNTNTLVDVFSYDQIEVICLVYDSLSNFVKIVASSFDSAGISIDLPSGDNLSNLSVLSFTSSDNSITITGNATTGAIDFIAVGGGGGSSTPYKYDFLSTDWVLDVDVYKIEILAALHLKGVNPTAHVFEDVLSDFEEVETSLELNASGDIILKVSQTPDLRFSGKTIIS